MKSSLNVNVQEIKSMIRALAEESKLEIPADFHILGVSPSCSVEMFTTKGNRDKIQFMLNIPPAFTQYYEEVPLRMRVGQLALVTRLLNLVYTKTLIPSPVTNSVAYQGKVYNNIRRLVENGFVPPWVVDCSKEVDAKFEDPTSEDISIYNDIVTKVAIHFSDAVMPDVVNPFPVTVKDFDAFIKTGKFEPVDESIFDRKMQE